MYLPTGSHLMVEDLKILQKAYKPVYAVITESDNIKINAGNYEKSYKFYPFFDCAPDLQH